MAHTKNMPDETNWLEIEEHRLGEVCGDSAWNWAAAFEQKIIRSGVKIDRGLMISYFAAAIEYSNMLRDVNNMKALNDVIDTQCSDGNWDYDPYMHGMANGLILARSVLDGMEPEYKTAPEKWLKDVPWRNNVEAEVDEILQGREGNTETEGDGDQNG